MIHGRIKPAGVSNPQEYQTRRNIKLTGVSNSQEYQTHRSNQFLPGSIAPECAAALLPSTAHSWDPRDKVLNDSLHVQQLAYHGKLLFYL